MKKLIWTALVMVVSATAAAVAAGALDGAWRRLVREPPPKPPRWAKYLIGGPLISQVASRVRPARA